MSYLSEWHCLDGLYFQALVVGPGGGGGGLTAENLWDGSVYFVTLAAITSEYKERVLSVILVD